MIAIMRMITKNAYLYSMKARLNLTIDEQLLAQVKSFARKHETNVSEMVEDFFRKAVSPNRSMNVIDIIESLNKPDIPAGADLKELYYKEKGKKYGL